MIKEEIKKQRIQAMKDREVIKKSILTVALGEIELVETREGSITEERCQKILRKMIENNDQTIEVLGEPPFVDQTMDKEFEKFFTLVAEKNILGSFLPQLWTKKQIKSHLQFIDDSHSVSTNRIDTMDNMGKAIGTAMRIFKDQQVSVNGKDVAAVVKELREEKDG